jgi:hypothetical protein
MVIVREGVETLGEELDLFRKLRLLQKIASLDRAHDGARDQVSKRAPRPSSLSVGRERLPSHRAVQREFE